MVKKKNSLKRVTDCTRWFSESTKSLFGRLSKTLRTGFFKKENISLYNVKDRFLDFVVKCKCIPYLNIRLSSFHLKIWSEFVSSPPPIKCNCGEKSF